MHDHEFLMPLGDNVDEELLLLLGGDDSGDSQQQATLTEVLAFIDASDSGCDEPTYATDSACSVHEQQQIQHSAVSCAQPSLRVVIRTTTNNTLSAAGLVSTAGAPKSTNAPAQPTASRHTRSTTASSPIAATATTTAALHRSYNANSRAVAKCRALKRVEAAHLREQVAALETQLVQLQRSGSQSSTAFWRQQAALRASERIWSEALNQKLQTAIAEQQTLSNALRMHWTAATLHSRVDAMHQALCRSSSTCMWPHAAGGGTSAELRIVSPVQSTPSECGERIWCFVVAAVAPPAMDYRLNSKDMTDSTYAKSISFVLALPSGSAIALESVTFLRKFVEPHRVLFLWSSDVRVATQQGPAFRELGCVSVARTSANDAHTRAKLETVYHVSCESEDDGDSATTDRASDSNPSDVDAAEQLRLDVIDELVSRMRSQLQYMHRLFRTSSSAATAPAALVCQPRRTEFTC